ncbi:NAD(P)H-quinone oxidoreductase [Phenylobacterium sp.]|uniref:NAD(P)H-quinone oxidoreductase n=1 Tax=Phenylobacterium sp. TaxID=1871053 RepID=UPI0035AFBEC5
MRLPDSMRVVEVVAGQVELGRRELPAIGADEVLLHVAASGVNRADISQREGRYPPPPGASDILGLEAAGVVVAVGEAVTNRKVGDVVCALLAGGGYAEFCSVPAVQTAAAPADLSLPQLAALLESACTVWDNIWRRGRLTSGETLLVHGGGSGIGVMAIQIAKALGHRVIVTVGTAEKRDRCLALGADAAAIYTQEDFVAAARAFTDGQGVDVILDMVGGPYLGRNLEALAADGRLAVISVSGGATGEANLRMMMQRRLTVTASTLRARSPAAKGEVVRDVEANVLPLIASGRVTAVVDQVFPVDDVESAHARMKASLHFGKLVLDWRV